MLSSLRLERKQHSNPFRIRIFLFLSYSFGIETIKTFIQSRSSLKNRTRFQTKMGKLYTRFQTKTVQTLPDGVAHTYIAYIREYSTNFCVFLFRNKMQSNLRLRSLFFLPADNCLKPLYNGHLFTDSLQRPLYFVSKVAVIYPGYQRFFSRAGGIFGVGRRPTHLRP